MDQIEFSKNVLNLYYKTNDMVDSILYHSQKYEIDFENVQNLLCPKINSILKEESINLKKIKAPTLKKSKFF